MTRLGYGRFLAQGSDWGTSVSTSLAFIRPAAGHPPVPPLAPPDRHADGLTSRERVALADWTNAAAPDRATRRDGTRPQTIGYSLTDSRPGCAPGSSKTVGLDRPPRRSQPGPHRRSGAGRHLLVLADWHRRLLGQAVLGEHRAGHRLVHQRHPRRHHRPAGCSVFPREVPRPSRRQAERRFANIVYWNEPDRGGHFAAWNNPPSSLTKSAPSPEAATTTHASPREHPRLASPAGPRPPRSQRSIGWRRQAPWWRPRRRPRA